MAIELLVPRPRIIVPKLPSYVKLDMAFGVGAGTSLYDKSRYRSHGAITGAAWAAGLHGYALDFVAATPSYVVIPATQTQLDFTSEDFSFIFRIKFDSIANNPIFYSRGVWNTDGIQLLAVSTGYVGCYTYQSTKNQISRSSIGSIVTATWYTIGISRVGASVKLYKNGVDFTAVAGTHINPATCARLATVGIDNDLSAQPTDGQIEFLRVFGGIALSASEHLAWHNALA